MTFRSDIARLIVLEILVALGALWLLSAVTRAQTDQRFFWCPVSGATNYELVWSTLPRTTDGVTPVGGTWNHQGRVVVPAPAEGGTVPAIQLTNNQRYFFSVRAQDATAWSGLSNEVCVRVGGGAPGCPTYLSVGTSCEDIPGKLPMPSIRIRRIP